MRPAAGPVPIAERPMVRRLVPRRVLFCALFSPVCALFLIFAGCGSSIRNAAPPASPASAAAAQAPAQAPEPAPLPQTPVEDPVIALIALSGQHFSAGQKNLELGHVEAARQEFDKALNVFLESPYDGRTEPRIREHFDRVVDRISALEVNALAEGEGLTDQKYDPGSIDELLAVSDTLTQPPPTPELKGTVESDLQTVSHDIPIPQNQKVLSYIQLFQGRLHDFIQEGMTRGAKYLPMIQGVFRAEGLPLDLAYVPLIESAFKPSALSRANAKGVWQFMRDTGVENGLRQDWYIDERSDPEKATAAAAKYLATLASMFDGDWHLVLASYNGGPGRVQRAMKRGNLTDFWKLSAKASLLPRETREYVPMILAAIVIARSPAEYGFELGLEAPPSYDTVTLPRPVDLRRIAQWTETTVDEIRALNPELRRWTTPVRDSAYTLKVPAGSAEVVSARLEDSVKDDLASLKYYTVKRGETIATIAKKLGVGRADLADANYLKSAARLSAGQQLMVPQEATAPVAARTDRVAPVADSRPIANDAVVATVEWTPSSDLVKTVYQVKKGDTLAAIARTFRTTVASLQTWNGIVGTQIRSGERLTIYTARAN
jgi:membrane-bound lytic murein transglycosylase D